MKKLLTGLGALLALLVLAALIAPSFINWNHYKRDVVKQIRLATGRRLSIDGDITVALLPTPHITITGVRLASLRGAAMPDMLVIRSAEASIAFPPLLQGQIRVESLTLHSPEFVLERLVDGRAGWQFSPPPERRGSESAYPSGAVPIPGAEVPMPALSRLPSWIRLDHLEIQNGTVTYRDDRTGFQTEVRRIEGGVSAGSLRGPFRAQGRGLARGVPITFGASLERAGDSRPSAFGLTLSTAGSQLTLTGTITEDKDGAAASGQLHVGGPDLRGALATLQIAGARTLPDFTARSFTIDGTLEVSARRAGVSSLVLRLGETEAKGGIDIAYGTPPRIATTLSLDRIDFDSWLAAKGPPPGHASELGPGAAPIIGGSGVKPSPPAAQPANAPIDYTLPDDVDATLDLSAENVVYRAGIIRQLRLGASLHKGVLSLGQLAASLPGGVDVITYGTIDTPKGQPHFVGNLDVEADNLRGALDWLKVDVAGVSPERLRKASVSTVIDLTPEALTLRDVSADIDSTHLVGGGTFLLRARPSFGVSVALDRLNLDAYLPELTATGEARPPAAGGKPAAAGPAAAVEHALEPLRVLDKFDANVRARADQLIVRGQAITGLRFDATVIGGKLTLHNAAVDDLAGVKGELTGSIAGVGDKPAVDLSLEASAGEIAPFLHFAGINPRVPTAQIGAFSIMGKFKGGLDKLGLDVSGTLMGGNYKAAGTVGLVGPPQYDLDLDVNQPQLARLLGLVVATPLPSDSRGFSFQGHVTGGPGALAVSGLKARSMLLDADGSFSASGLPDKPTLKADLKLASHRLGFLLSLARVTPAPDPALDRLGLVGATLQADGDEGNFTIDGRATALGGTLAVVGKVATARGAPAYDVTVKAEAPDLTPLVSALSLDADAKGLGPFTLSGRVEGDVADFTLSDFQTSSSVVDASGSIELRDMIAKPAVKANFDFNAKRLPLLFTLMGAYPTGPFGRLQTLAAKGSVAGVPDAMALDLAGSGDGVAASAKGMVGLGKSGPTYDVTINASAKDLGAVLRLVAPRYSAAAASQGGFALQVRAAGQPDQATFSDIQAKLGPTSVTGSVKAAFGAPRPKLTVQLAATPLDLDALLPVGTAAGGRPMAAPRDQTVAAASSHWSPARLDLGALDDADADISIQAQTATLANFRLEGARLAATLADDVLTVSSLTGKLDDGDLKLSGKLDAKAQPNATLTVRLDQAKIGESGIKLGPMRLASGLLSFAADLKAAGWSEQALIDGLNGSGNVALTDGTIDGLNLPALNDRLGQMDKPVDIVALVRAAGSGGSTRVGRAGGTFTVKDGVVENRDLAIEADGPTGKGQGDVDLPRWYMDYGVEFHLKAAADVPPFSIKLRGPLDEPHKILFSNELQEYLLKRSMNAVMKQLQKGGAAAAPSDGQAPPEKPPTGKEILNDLLKSLQPPGK